MLAPYVISGIVLLSVLGAFAVHNWRADKDKSIEQIAPDKQTFKGVVMRTIKIFAFIVGLELLGAGFQPVIDQFVITMSNTALYFMNLLSAILDNATLAAAEISLKMSALQIQTILMSILISGGMLITGNIPNIITAGRLKIRSRDWAKIALPIGAVMFVIYFVLNFILHI